MYIRKNNNDKMVKKKVERKNQFLLKIGHWGYVEMIKE